jgi:hypothetical protein
MTIGSITPPVGINAGGTAISVTGTGFASGVYVGIGGILATSVIVVSDTLITAVTPAKPGAPAAMTAVDVTLSMSVDLSNGVTMHNGFCYADPMTSPGAPAIFSITPGELRPNDDGTLIIAGVNFAAGFTLSIGGVDKTGTTTLISASELSVAWEGFTLTVGAYDVVYTAADAQTSTLSGGFQIVDALPGDVQQFVVLAEAPSAPAVGQVYFDSSATQFKGWTGTAWVPMSTS